MLILRLGGVKGRLRTRYEQYGTTFNREEPLQLGELVLHVDRPIPGPLLPSTRTVSGARRQLNERENKRMQDLTVASEDGVPVATRDFGGSGPAVVLLHGFGRTLIDWSIMAPRLAAHYRTVAFDLRGHGKSGDGIWSWNAALCDVAAVARELELGIPAVVGHSLGGMLAVMWAKANPEVRGVVNLDGHGHRTLTQYSGIDPADAQRRIAAADDRVKASLSALSGPLLPPVVDGLLA